ncbi:MAG: SDR family NAD(P)-dependent oxidoreductase [Trueperaceae bacterium]|nr:MAG: SDR family NAD(P)-dependent oxidoreductase [Trueperaceae bacterium]
MRVLVTGALGFVGVNIVRQQAERGQQVVALARREPDPDSVRFLGDAGAEVEWVRGDVTDRPLMAELVGEVGITHILHAAAFTATPEQEAAQPARLFDVNAGGTLNLLEAAREGGVQRLVFVSSSGVYGAAPPEPLKREDAPLTIRNLYAVCKETSERLCRRYSELCGFDAVVGRLGTAYGPMERTTRSRHGMSAVYSAAHAALADRRLTVHGAEIARDFCHVVDVADAYIALLFADVLCHGVYNVAADGAFPLSDALHALADARPAFSWTEAEAGDAELVQVPANARAGLDISRLKEDTGWRPRFDLSAGATAYLDWLENGWGHV